MKRRLQKTIDEILAAAPTLPLDEQHWQVIFNHLELSEMQARVVELMLRDFTNPQIAALLNISKSTVETYQQRIRERTGARGRMQLAMHILGVSHQVRERKTL